MTVYHTVEHLWEVESKLPESLDRYFLLTMRTCCIQEVKYFKGGSHVDVMVTSPVEKKICELPLNCPEQKWCPYKGRVVVSTSISDKVGQC